MKTEELSRELIINYLKDKYDALSFDVIRKGLNITDKTNEDKLEYILNKLVRDNIVRKTKKEKFLLFEHCNNFKTGTIVVKKEGYGFIDFRDENGNEIEPSIHITPDRLKFALDGDEVTVELLSEKVIDGRVKREGKVIEVTKRNVKNIVGEIKNSKNGLYFEPRDKKDIVLKIDKESFDACVEGEVVVVSVLDNIDRNVFTATVAKHIGHKDDPHMDIVEIAAKYDIFTEFPEAAIRQAEELPNDISNEDLTGRVDLRNEMIYTIDGKDTKDIDDAISVTFKDGYYNLKVSIADVSYYVTDKSPLDIEAQTRGTSSYLADTVIPMLPHKLSNGICSLNEDVDRLAITCDMKIDSRGVVVDSSIYPSIIHSVKKMNYDDVNEILENDNVPEGYEEFADNLRLMNELAHLIREDRNRRGASNFETEEAKVKCDETGKAIEVVKRKQRSGELLIEDMMIAANETVASYIFYMEYPFVYRIHATPKAEKIEKFVDFCNLTGHKVRKPNTDFITPREYQKLLAQLDLTEDEKKIYHALAIRTMPKAIYDSYNEGHFGLASTCYTHFTSPIRRYPDLMVHRLLRTYIFECRNTKEVINYYDSVLPSITKRCSEREQKATEAEREVNDMKFAEYMMDHIGEEYSGIITSVGGLGFYVQLDNLIEGRVSIKDIEGDYFEYNDDLKALVGRNTKMMYQIGNRVDIVVANANKETQTIDFELARTKKKTEETEGPVRKRSR